MHFQKKPLDNISHPTSSTSPTPHKAYGYTEEELPVYVVTESDGESNSPVKIRSSSEPSHAANTTASPTPPPAQSPRFHLKPWMIVAGLCLVLGTGCCIFLACSPSTRCGGILCHIQYHFWNILLRPRAGNIQRVCQSSNYRILL